MKIIRTGLSVLRILSLMVSALGLVGCILAQKEGSYWDQHYDYAFNATATATCIVVVLSFAELFFRATRITKNTPLRTNCLISGFALFIIPYLWAIFISEDLRALHLANFLAACGMTVFVGFLPKNPEKIVEVETSFE